MSDHDRCFYVFTLSEGEEVACNNTRKDHNTFTFGNHPQHPFTGPPASDAALRALVVKWRAKAKTSYALSAGSIRANTLSIVADELEAAGGKND